MREEFKCTSISPKSPLDPKSTSEARKNLIRFVQFQFSPRIPLFYRQSTNRKKEIQSNWTMESQSPIRIAVKIRLIFSRSRTRLFSTSLIDHCYIEAARESTEWINCGIVEWNFYQTPKCVLKNNKTRVHEETCSYKRIHNKQ